MCRDMDPQHDPHPAPPTLSADGRWIWDGHAWAPVPGLLAEQPTEIVQGPVEIHTRRPNPPGVTKQAPSGKLLVGLAVVVLLMFGGAFAANRALGGEQAPDAALRDWLAALDEGDGDRFCELSDLAEADEDTCKKQMKKVAPLFKDIDMEVDAVGIEIAEQDASSATLNVEADGFRLQVPMRKVDDQWKVAHPDTIED